MSTVKRQYTVTLTLHFDDVNQAGAVAQAAAWINDHVGDSLGVEVTDLESGVTTYQDVWL